MRVGGWCYALRPASILASTARPAGDSTGQLRLAGGGPLGSVEVVQSSADLAQHLTRMADLRFGALPPRGVPVINVDDHVTYQHVAGFGAAMTDTSAWLLQRELSPAWV